MSTPHRLRRASVGDLAAIEWIEQRSFGNPWPADAYAQEMERDLASVQVAEDFGSGRVLGMACVWIVGDEAHLLRIAAAPDRRRCGVGGDLLAWALDHARDAGCTTMTLEVAARNEPALGLYRRAGFAIIGRRPGYYRVPPDDAIVMQRALDGPPSPQAPSEDARARGGRSGGG